MLCFLSLVINRQEILSIYPQKLLYPSNPTPHSSFQGYSASGWNLIPGPSLALLWSSPLGSSFLVSIPFTLWGMRESSVLSCHLPISCLHCVWEVGLHGVWSGKWNQVWCPWTSVERWVPEFLSGVGRRGPLINGPSLQVKERSEGCSLRVYLNLRWLWNIQ